MFRTRRRKVVAVVALLALAAGTALAAWLVNGSGTGSAKAGTLASPTLETVATPVGDLFPNASPTGTLSISITNPNSELVLKGVSQNTGTAVSSSDVSNTDCPFANVTLPAKTGLSIPVPSGTSRVDIASAVRLDPSAPTACQGASFSIPVDAQFSTP